MRKMIGKSAFVLLALLFLLVGCSSSSKPAANGSTDSAKTGEIKASDKPAGSKALKEIRLAVPHTSLFDVSLPVYVAQEKGFYEEAGLKMDTIFTKGGGDTLQGAIAGSIDIGLATGPQSVIAAYTRGAPLKIISAQITGYDIYWVAKGDSPYKTLKDLAGKKIGFSSVGSSTDMAVKVLNSILKKENMPEMTGMPLGSPPDQITAVLTGQVDAGFSSAPTGFNEVDAGKLRIVIKGAEIEEYKNVAARVNFANAEFLKNNPDTVKAFLSAQQKAIDWIFANRDEAMAIWKKKADMKEDLATLKKTYDFYTPEMLRLAPVDGIDKIVEDSITYKFIDKAPSADQIKILFDLQYVPVTKK
jgi:NitT/TauT family transport system substrate-binding protein